MSGTRYSCFQGRVIFFLFRLTGFLIMCSHGLAVAAEIDKSFNTQTITCDRIVVFVSSSCSHCAKAREYLSELKLKDPRLNFHYREVTLDLDARLDFAEINSRHGIKRPGVPTFDVCGRLIVGFDPERVLEGIYDTKQKPASINLPLLGELGPSSVGLPLFTIAVGLVDGFNPCAMWVLMFLLSILVHIKQRRRILLIAGTFVLVSGVVYFAFMAAWLNAFFFIGYSRNLQLVLGSVALVIGGIHMKDFFALHHGISLSIPESAKPGLYGRIRRVVRAENMAAAIGGTIFLAILVNFVELLCTAGLPALYTQVLSLYELTTPAYYGYLILYNIAYIVDDGLMVAIAVITLGQRKLQEHEGRWLKLISGLLIFGLGLLLLLAPGLLAI